jgi:hypothetical protein
MNVGEMKSGLQLTQVIDIGDSVVCDDCSTEFRGSLATGGILVQSKAICPTCTPKWVEMLTEYDEMHLVRARCPMFKTFHAWVMELRGGDNSIKVFTTKGK